MEIGGVTTSLPADARFFNVDRAMSLYFTRPGAEAMRWMSGASHLMAQSPAARIS